MVRTRPGTCNPHDCTAVAVDVDGIRCGYLSAGLAQHYHWTIRACNRRGRTCVVAGNLEDDLSDWNMHGAAFIQGDEDHGEDSPRHLVVALPTLDVMQSLPEVSSVVDDLEGLYDALPQLTRDQIVEDDFRIVSRAVAAEIVIRRHMVPDLGLPGEPDPELLPRAFDHFLKKIRLRFREEQARACARARVEREHQRQVERDTAKAQKAKEKSAQAQTVLDSYRAGMSRTHIAAQLGMASQTVSKVLRQAGIQPGKTGLDAYGEGQAAQRRQRARLSVQLQDAGFSRSQIADQMKVSLETLKALLSLGKFLANPERYPARLHVAQRAHLEGWTRSTTKGGVAQRAVSDARDLLETRPHRLVVGSICEHEERI